MKFSDYFLIFEGGNTEAINFLGKSKFADKIDLGRIKIKNFRTEFSQLFLDLNKKFKSKFKYPLWGDESIIKSGFVFNGSTSYIMDPNINADEILKFKTHAGDIDIMVPSESMSDLWLLLRELEGKKVGKNFTYFGNNKPNQNALGTQINAIFVFHHPSGDINCQIDFEASDFENDRPTDFAKFGHGSSFDDARVEIKALHHKYLLRCLVSVVSANPNIIVATPASTAEKITLKKTQDTPKMYGFSVDRGLGYSLEPIIGKDGKIVEIDGKQVYKEKKTDDKKYIKDLSEIFRFLFNTNENFSKFYSFVGLVDLLKLYCDKETIKKVQKSYFRLLFGDKSQVIELYDPKSDCIVKMKGYNYFLEKLNLKHPNLDNDVNHYYEVRKNSFKKKI